MQYKTYQETLIIPECKSEIKYGVGKEEEEKDKEKYKLLLKKLKKEKK